MIFSANQHYLKHYCGKCEQRRGGGKLHFPPPAAKQLLCSVVITDIVGIQRAFALFLSVKADYETCRYGKQYESEYRQNYYGDIY